MRDERRAGLGAEPWTMFSTPAGRPASWASRPKIAAVSGVSSALLSTAVLPQTSAGNTFQATLAIGVFAGTIRPATPSGCRTVIAVPVRRRRWSWCGRRGAGPRWR